MYARSLTWGHRTAIETLLTSKTSRELQKLRDFNKLTILQRPRAEELIPVAAASVLARAAREEWLDDECRLLKADIRALSEKEV